MGVFIVFVDVPLKNLSLHILDESYYRPPLSPPKNPIKREKKKLAYFSEREDFIQRGEDQFCPLLESPLEGSANCIFIQLQRAC